MKACIKRPTTNSVTSLPLPSNISAAPSPEASKSQGR
jgi:hypothetical protein